MEKYFEDHFRMNILRQLAKKDPNGMVAFALKTIDEEIEKLEKEKKKYGFIKKL